ncbi:hypothetical protein P167DRAFT_150107 [Morchella conica CCBAS932]|uniref:Uncharacterized protein n=1 Tax=Morchella conica CCBAS932 TaxID=1392247 RepID=A0A3N4L3P4_9PEZI|nr:hypothetical protein P167DRAFT_150107 [Morchella conica CCBAS932]
MLGSYSLSIPISILSFHFECTLGYVTLRRKYSSDSSTSVSSTENVRLSFSPCACFGRKDSTRMIACAPTSSVECGGGWSPIVN